MINAEVNLIQRGLGRVKQLSREERRLLKRLRSSEFPERSKTASNLIEINRDQPKNIKVQITTGRPSLSRERVQSRDINDVLILEEGVTNEDSFRQTFASASPL
jgi:hypothetical protein